MSTDISRAATPRRSGFTLIEACVIVVIIAILTVILVSIFKAGQVHHGTCGVNLQEIGLGIEQYMQDYDEQYPRTVTLVPSGVAGPRKWRSWRQAIFPYVKFTQSFRCTLSKEDRGGLCAVDGLPQSYDVADCGPVRVDRSVHQKEVRAPANTILVFEENGDTPQGQQIGVLWDHDSGEPGWTNILYAGHLGGSGYHGSYYLFADAHVKWLRPLDTIADGINRWHVNIHDPVSARAMEKLKAAQQNFPD